MDVTDDVSHADPYTSNTCQLLLLLVGSVLLIYTLPVASWIRRIWSYYVVSQVHCEELPCLQLPPGTMGYPFIGETLDFLRKGADFYHEKLKLYGNVYKTHLLGRPTIRVIGAENVKKILLGENTIVTQNWPKSTRLLLGSGSISQSSGHVHKIRRKHMLHAFGQETLEAMVPEIQEGIRSCLQDWTTRRDIFVYPECKSMTFVVSACSLIGLDAQDSRKSGMDKTFRDFLANLMTLPYDIPGFGFRQGKQAKHRLIQKLRDILPGIHKRPYTPVMKAYYDSCEKLESITDQEIFEGVLDLLFAGHETITSTVTNCIMFLGQQPDVVNRLRKEIEEHTGTGGTEFDFKTINDMSYLNCIVKEVLRLCPPAGGGFRKALKSFEVGGYLVPKDWAIIYSIRETQHTSPIFENSEQFCPERWEKISEMSETEGVDVAKFHYIPFGIGARSCVGKIYAQLVVKIFLIELVCNCSWTLKNKDIRMQYIPIPVAVDHLPAVFTTYTK